MSQFNSIQNGFGKVDYQPQTYVSHHISYNLF